METICFEMAVYVSRTATTPILNQSNERNASLLDRHGRLAALMRGALDEAHRDMVGPAGLPDDHLRLDLFAQMAHVQEPFTVIVLPPGASAELDPHGSYDVRL